MEGNLKNNELRDAVFLKMNGRDEVSIDEMRAIIFGEYSMYELMRRAACRNPKTKICRAYLDGDSISDVDRDHLCHLGIETIINCLRFESHWIEIDKKNGVARRVRK